MTRQVKTIKQSVHSRPLFKNSQKLGHRTLRDLRMNNDELLHQFELIRNTLATQNEAITFLHKQASDKTDSTKELVLPEQITACITPHLQLAPLEPADRKKILKQYHKVSGFPKCIKDDNGLAAHAIGANPDVKKRVHDWYPAVQRQHLDIARIGANAWSKAGTVRDADPGAAAEILVTAMRDIITLACDNAQLAAQQQLKQTLEAAGQGPVYALRPSTGHLGLLHGPQRLPKRSGRRPTQTSSYRTRVRCQSNLQPERQRQRQWQR
jgi:hypothetical protein